MRPDEAFAIGEALSTVRRAMQTVLKPRELAIIEARFGFNGHRCTLARIAADQKVSTGRIHEIETKALRKLKGGHLRPTLYHALEILGGHPQPSGIEGTEEWCRLGDKERERQRFERLEARRVRMLELDVERTTLGDNPSYDEFSAYLTKWASVSWTSDLETNAFVNASDWQLHRRRESLLMRDGAPELFGFDLTPQARDEARASHGLPPYPNEHTVAEWLALYADSAEAQSA